MKPCFSCVPLVCLVNCAVHSISYCYIHECNLKPVSFQIVLPLCPLFLYLQFHLFLFDTSFRFLSFLFLFLGFLLREVLLRGITLLELYEAV